jgi:hypothetical protein
MLEEELTTATLEAVTRVLGATEVTRAEAVAAAQAVVAAGAGKHLKRAFCLNRIEEASLLNRAPIDSHISTPQAARTILA